MTNVRVSSHSLHSEHLSYVSLGEGDYNDRVRRIASAKGNAEIGQYLTWRASQSLPVAESSVKHTVGMLRKAGVESITFVMSKLHICELDSVDEKVAQSIDLFVANGGKAASAPAKRSARAASAKASGIVADKLADASVRSAKVDK